MISYALDSSIIIKMRRETPIEFYPSLWNKFKLLIDAGRLSSIDVVFRELTSGKDDAEVWAKENQNLFMEISEDVILETKKIVNQHPIINIDSEKDQADPYLLGYAKTKKLTLLTDERYKPNKINLPSVCREINIDCFNLFDLFKAEGWTF